MCRTNGFSLLVMLAMTSSEVSSIPADPSVELEGFQIAEGLEVNLFASEPMVVNPIQMAFDPQGRLWVVGSSTYPHVIPGEEPDDKLVVLEDIDGDGRADKHTVFADKLYVPTGFELGDGGAYVANQPDLLFIEDKDGDGYGESRKILLSGFGTEDNHHAISAWRWGPGGFLYFQSGIFLHTQVETPYGVTRLETGGIFQFHPRRLKLDLYVVSNSFANPWGHAFDRWGQDFLTEAPGGNIYFLAPGQVSIPTEGPYPRIEGAPKSCGVEFLSGNHWPEDWQGDLILNAFKSRVVHRYKFSDDGSGFTAREMDPLIVSTEEFFRPVDVKIGPDGAIYILDWYNPIIGHMQYNFRDPRRDHSHGRVWRITMKDRPLQDPSQLVGNTIDELLENLKSDFDYTRHQARRVLYDSDPEIVTQTLDKWVEDLDEDDPDFEHHRLEALWTYQTLDEVNPDLLEKVLRSPDYRARAAATRVLRHWIDRLENPLPLLAKQVQDEHPRVRLEAVVALSFVPDPKAMELATLAVHRPMDRYIEFALRHTSKALQPHWLPLLQQGELSFQGDSKRLSFALQSLQEEGVVQPLLELLQSGDIARERKEHVLNLVASLGGPHELSQLLNPITYSDLRNEPGPFIRNWEVLAPLPYDPRLPLEEESPVPEGESFAFNPPSAEVEGETVDWRNLSADKKGVVDLARKLEHRQPALAYALARIESISDRDVIFEVRSNDGVEAFLNGEKIHSNDVERGISGEPDLVPGSLRKGVNDLVLKVANAGNDWGFSARVVAEAGQYDANLHARVLAELRRAAHQRGVLPEGNLIRISEFFESDNQTLASESILLAGAWRLKQAEPIIADIAQTADRSPMIRQAAVESLGYLGGEAASGTLRKLIGAASSTDLKSSAIAALARIDPRASAKLAAKVLAEGAEHPEAIEPLFSAFLGRKGGSASLLEALEEEHRSNPLPQDAAKIALRYLYSIGVQQADLIEFFTTAAGIIGGPRELSQDEMVQLISEVQKNGNPVHGEMVFRREDLSCLKCHAILGAGGQVAPDLAGLGASAFHDYIIEAILSPNKAVREGYEGVMVETEDGDLFHGTLARETSNEIVLRDPSEGEVDVPKEGVADRRGTASIMPAGLADLLTRSELVDLVRFISELGKPGPFATPNQPVFRRWRVLDPVPGRLARANTDPPPVDADNDEGLEWKPAYSLVSGKLPLEPSENGRIRFVKAEVEVTTPGPIGFRLNSSNGLDLWVGEEKVAARESMIVDLGTGVHSLVFRVDLESRNPEGIRLEIEEVSGSPGRALPVGGI